MSLAGRILKPFLPDWLRSRIIKSIILHRESTLRQMPMEDAFDTIYRKKIWGSRNNLSGPGSYGKWAAEYVSCLRRLIQEFDIHTIFDAGCGDFNVGMQISPYVESYIAADISKTIIDRNRKEFRDLGNVKFLHANICKDAIPYADLVTVRQVFQHLTNAQIDEALRNIEMSNPRLIVIGEHVCARGQMTVPNIDLAAHSSGTRVSQRSGVIISAPPFSRNATLYAEIEGNTATESDDESVLAVFILKRSSD